MKDSKQEKRVLKGYKIKDSVYRKAMKRAKKDNTSLAARVEMWVSLYADGESMVAFKDPNKLTYL